MSPFLQMFETLRGAAVRAGPGETLFHRGDPVRVLYLVRSGAAHLTRVDPGGRTAVMQRAGPGEVLAEASLFSEVCHCDAVVTVAAELIRIRKADALAHLARDPALMHALAAHLAREVQRMRGRLEVLARRTVAERLDAWLALGEGTLPPQGRWRAVAEEIGVSPEAFYRELARRRRAGPSSGS